jgi:hypothetical protein
MAEVANNARSGSAAARRRRLVPDINFPFRMKW